MTPRAPYSLDDLRSIIARVPWWASLLGAVAAYAILHPLTMLHTATPSGALDTIVAAIVGLFLGVAGIAQYFLPFALVAAAGASAFVHWKRENLLGALTSDPGDSALRGLSRSEVALLLSAAFRDLGFRARQAQGFLRDEGFDMDLYRRGERILLQHRHWRSYRIDSAPLRPLCDLLETVDADRGIVVVSGQFTPDAIALAERRGLELFDGSRLKELVLPQRTAPQGADENRWLRLVRQLAALLPGATRPTARPIIDSTHIPQTSHAPGRPRQEMEDDATDQELALGDALTALIRAETPSSLESRPTIAAPPATEAAVSEPKPKAKTRRRLPVRRILDIAGMFAALGLIWNAYAWFAALPQVPQRKPWAPSAPDATASETAGLTQPHQDQPTTGRALGRFEFGPPLTQAPIAEPTQDHPLPTEEPSEDYQSIQELEAAFNAKYVPPPECYDLSSTGQMASCGNHRIRSRRAFIESNGRTLDPTPPAAQPTQRSAWQPNEADWSGEEEEPSPGWQEPTGWTPKPAWETKPGWLTQDGEQAQRWRSMQDWPVHEHWTPRREPLDAQARDDRSAWSRETDWPPRVQRQAVEDWRPPSDWRSQLAEPRESPPAGDPRWQHKWLREPDTATPDDAYRQ